MKPLQRDEQRHCADYYGEGLQPYGKLRLDGAERSAAIAAPV